MAKSTKRRNQSPKIKAFVIDQKFTDAIDASAEIEARIRSESDRGCALVCGAAIEEVLGGLLTAYFGNAEISEALLGPSRPLSTFSSRLYLCRGIGLLSDDLYRDIDSVRFIRNQAAHFDRRKGHGHDFDFTRQDIADRCRGLRSFAPTMTRRCKPRNLFERFAAMLVACLAEHAAIWKVTSDNVPVSFVREGMLDLIPKMRIKKYLSAR
jgi:hypothetical protein